MIDWIAPSEKNKKQKMRVDDMLFSLKTQEKFIIKEINSQSNIVVERMYENRFMGLWMKIKKIFGHHKPIILSANDSMMLIPRIGEKNA